MATTDTKTAIHKWDDKVGPAPYQLVCCVNLPRPGLAEANTTAYNDHMVDASHIAQAHGVTLATCYVCGMALMHNYICRAANGAHFVVGSDCVQKLGDHRLVSAVEAAERRRQRKLARDRADTRREARRREQEAKLDEQRKRNGGYTDHELAEQAREQAEAEQRILHATANTWMIETLHGMPGGFAQDMSAALHRAPLNRNNFTDRQIECLCDIYAKQHGRRNSKGYTAAHAEALARIDH